MSPGIVSGGAMNFDGGDITSSAGTITALGFSGSLLDDTGSSGLATYVPTANGDGTWTWAAGGGGGSSAGTMNFDGGLITSDGGGDATFVSIYAQELKDSGGNTGSADNYAQANGSGGWQWAAWPATLNYDSGDITSDGGGNITATSFRGSLLDDTGSSGLATYVPTANGDGTWTWAPGGGGGGGLGNVHYGGPMMFDYANGQTNILSDGIGDLSVAGDFVAGANSLPSGYPANPFTLVDYDNDVALQLGYNGNDGFSLEAADAYWTVNTTFYFSSSQFEAYSYGAPMVLIGPFNSVGSGAGDFGFDTWNPVETVDISGNFGCDWEQIYSDGSGNLTANTFNPVSDRNRKEHIAPLAPTNALAMALSFTNYTWRFKAHTNWVVSKIPTSLCTNLVTHTRTNKAGLVLTRTNWVVVTNSFVLATNAGKIFPASGTEFGPMAQDWHATTGLGGGTNISITSMNGLLLGAIQGLAATGGTFTNQAGARFALVVNAQTNGFIFVPQ